MGAAALAGYVALHPDLAGPYGRMAGIVAVCLSGAAIWMAGRAAVYFLGGD
jgi:hypothetical protein